MIFASFIGRRTLEINHLLVKSLNPRFFEGAVSFFKNIFPRGFVSVILSRGAESSGETFFALALSDLTRASSRDGFFTVIGALLLVAVSALLLKSFGFRGAPVVVAVGLVSALSHYSDALSEIFGMFTYLDTVSGAHEYVSAAVKIIGISYISGISADVCREIGESGVAKCISVITRLELIALSLPFIKEIISLAFSLVDY